MSTQSSDDEYTHFPGATPPDRIRSVNSHGLRLAVYEWGDEDDPPVLMAHGGFDFARTFDVFAPLIAVVSVWLYTLVFAFASLWFAHFSLARLQSLRAAHAARMSQAPVLENAAPA